MEFEWLGKPNIIDGATRKNNIMEQTTERLSDRRSCTSIRELNTKQVKVDLASKISHPLYCIPTQLPRNSYGNKSGKHSNPKLLKQLIVYAIGMLKLFLKVRRELKLQENTCKEVYRDKLLNPKDNRSKLQQAHKTKSNLKANFGQAGEILTLSLINSRLHNMIHSEIPFQRSKTSQKSSNPLLCFCPKNLYKWL